METDYKDDMIINEQDFPDTQMTQEDAQMDFELRRASLEETVVPDVDAAFEQFKEERLTPYSKTARRIPMWIITAIAACLLVAFFLPWNKWFSTPSPENEPLVSKVEGNVVYEAVEPMSDIALTMGKKTINLHSKDAEQQGFSVTNDEMIKFLAPENVSPSDRTTLTIPQGKTAKLLLPDGSKVWLSACSRLIFPQAFLKDAPREVRLIGEAYFEVTHDEARPFIVHSGNVSTTVLGTQFNIRCFEGEKIRVTLASGSVKVRKEGNSVRRNEVILVPGQQAMIGSSSVIDVDGVDVEGVLSWKNGAFYFEDQTLREVLTEIGRWYNYNVIFASNSHLDDKLHYNGERHWRLKQVIDQLNRICDTNIRIEDNNIIVNEY